MSYTPTAFFNTAYAELDKIDVRARRLFAALDDAALNRQPRPGAWSPGQCFEHLVKVNRLYLPAFDRALQHAKITKPAGQRSFSHSLLERYFIWMLEPPAQMKLPAISNIAAVSGERLDRQKIQADYFATHTEFRERMERARNVDIKQTKITSPIAAWWKLSVAAAVDVILAHERRHLVQAERGAGIVK